MSTDSTPAAAAPEPEDERKKISGALMASGFPFQLAVRDLLSRGHWNAYEQEFPWHDEYAGKDEFIDMVAAIPGRAQAVQLVVECKKTTKESFVFLQTKGKPGNWTDRFSGVVSYSRRQPPKLEPAIGEYTFSPKSHESDFCVVCGLPGSSERLLEKDVIQKLVRGTDAFSQAFCDGFTKAGETLSHDVFVPVLVTNAPIYITEFEPVKDVSLKTGSFNVPPDATAVDFVRFRKTFVSGGGGKTFERTVFVVSVEKLQQFIGLIGFHMERDPDRVWPLR